MKIKKNIATSAEGFIFNPATGDSFSTNTIGNIILNMLKNNLTKEEITEHICLNYQVEQAYFEKDLEDFLQQLIRFRIVDTQE